MLAAVLVLPLALAALPAGAEEISTPEGRARLEVRPSQQGDTGRLEMEGNVGAFGFQGAAEGSPNHLRVEDPPSYGALELDPDGLHMEYEETFGPRIANATIGTGGMTEGIDAHGRLTNLGWPDPGLYEHVNSLNVSRRWPNQGKPENAGSFGGVVIDGEPTWLHPSFGWEQAEAQRYESEDSQTVVTVLRRGEPGSHVNAVITDVVHPDEEVDVIARNFRFTGPGAEDIEDFVYYANMNPTTSRAPRTPSVFDGAADNASDFATAYDPDASSMLHFRPYQVDPASLSRLATSQPSAETAQEAVEGSFGPGVYIAVAGHGDATAHQAGQETGGLVREGPQADPFYDFAADGELSGAPAAFGKTAGALRLPPDRDRGRNRSYTVYLAAGESPDDAQKRIGAARDLGFGKIREASEDYWSEWLDDARLPDEDGAVGAVGKRGLMAIRTAQSRLTGAIVANTTTQTPYRQDWIRDGAFFNYALLLAGKTEMVLEHNAFYDGIYRPGGVWDSIYYTDGAEAGFTFPYEIDTQAFAIWALWLPYEFRETAFATDAAAEDYLAGAYGAIRDTAEAIMLCRDPLNDLQCYAAEDDAFQPSQGAQGASTVYLALQNAAEAADVLGKPADRDRWRTRAEELRAAAIRELCSEQGGRTRCGGGRGGIYMSWPSNLLRDAVEAGELTAGEHQEHLTHYAEKLDGRSAEDFADRTPDPGGAFQYPMEPILALAPQWEGPDKADRASRWIEWLATEVAEPGVLHYGERIFRCAGQDPCEADREYLHTIGFPHIWSGVEQYMASAFVHGLRDCPEDVSRVGEADCS